MIKQIKILLGKIGPKNYMSYEEYHNKIKFMDDYGFTQSVLKENIANGDPIGSSS